MAVPNLNIVFFHLSPPSSIPNALSPLTASLNAQFEENKSEVDEKKGKIRGRRK